jgi:hypothetical protein
VLNVSVPLTLSGARRLPDGLPFVISASASAIAASISPITNNPSAALDAQWSSTLWR